MPRFRAPAISALIALLFPATSAAVTIDLRPGGLTTIEIGGMVNVDVFMVLDASDQAAGIGAVTMHLELGSASVSVVAAGTGSPFPMNTVSVVPSQDFILFSQAGTTVTSAEAQLGTLAITGVALRSYDLVARRFENFPLFTAPGDTTNRYDFTSDESLTILILIPEPSTWLLLSLGIAGMVMVRRKLASRA